MPQWITREYMARRGGARFGSDQVSACRCPLLGRNPDSISVEGQNVSKEFFKVEKQPEVGVAAYDHGAAMLRDFFINELSQYTTPDLLPLGREIIDCCMNDGSIEDYHALIPHETIVDETNSGS